MMFESGASGWPGTCITCSAGFEEAGDGLELRIVGVAVARFRDIAYDILTPATGTNQPTM